MVLFPRDFLRVPGVPMPSIAPASKAATSACGPWTWDDFVALPTGDRRELLDGHLFEVEIPTDMHEFIVAELIRLLGNWAVDNGGKVLASGYKVKISTGRGVMPDVQFYRPGRKTARQGLVEGAPDLAVEVISPTSRGIDRVTKLGYYQQIGTPEYWLVDPDAQTIEVFVQEGGRWWLRERAIWPIGPEAGGDATCQPASFAGLVVSLPRLFEGNDS